MYTRMGGGPAGRGEEQARPSCSYPSRGRSREVRENRACAAANLASVAVDHDVDVGLARFFLGSPLLVWILGSRGYRLSSESDLRHCESSSGEDLNSRARGYRRSELRN